MQGDGLPREDAPFTREPPSFSCFILPPELRHYGNMGNIPRVASQADPHNSVANSIFVFCVLVSLFLHFDSGPLVSRFFLTQKSRRGGPCQSCTDPLLFLAWDFACAARNRTASRERQQFSAAQIDCRNIGE